MSTFDRLFGRGEHQPATDHSPINPEHLPGLYFGRPDQVPADDMMRELGRMLGAWAGADIELTRDAQNAAIEMISAVTNSLASNRQVGGETSRLLVGFVLAVAAGAKAELRPRVEALETRIAQLEKVLNDPSRGTKR